MSNADEEQPQVSPREQLVKEKSMTMEYFLESRNLDKVTEEMLRKYDTDGDGAFSKDEVVSIIIDLRQEHVDNDKLSATNKLYKRLLITSILLCIFLLAGMFALSYAVAALTAKTDVNSEGTLVAAGTTTAVATDSRAEIHVVPMSDNGFYCITPDEIELMQHEVTLGREVVLDKSDLNGEETIAKVSGGTVVVTVDGTCFTTSSGEVECVSYFPECEGREVGRRLSSDDRLRLGMPERRRLQGREGNCIGCSTASSGILKGCVNSDGELGGPQYVFNGSPYGVQFDGCNCSGSGWCTSGYSCVATDNCSA